MVETLNQLIRCNNYIGILIKNTRCNIRMVHIPLKKRKYTLQIVALESTFGCAEALNYYFITAVSNRIFRNYISPPNIHGFYFCKK